MHINLVYAPPLSPPPLVTENTKRTAATDRRHVNVPSQQIRRDIPSKHIRLLLHMRRHVHRRTDKRERAKHTHIPQLRLKQALHSPIPSLLLKSHQLHDEGAQHGKVHTRAVPPRLEALNRSTINEGRGGSSPLQAHSKS